MISHVTIIKTIIELNCLLQRLLKHKKHQQKEEAAAKPKADAASAKPKKKKEAAAKPKAKPKDARAVKPGPGTSTGGITYVKQISFNNIYDNILFCNGIGIKPCDYDSLHRRQQRHTSGPQRPAAAGGSSDTPAASSGMEEDDDDIPVMLKVGYIWLAESKLRILFGLIH